MAVEAPGQLRVVGEVNGVGQLLEPQAERPVRRVGAPETLRPRIVRQPGVDAHARPRAHEQRVRGPDQVGGAVEQVVQEATERCTTSNSSSDDPDATGRARSPECAVMAGPFSQAWKDSSLSQCVTTK